MPKESTPDDVRLWVRAARVMCLPALWRGQGDGGGASSGGGSSGDGSNSSSSSSASGLETWQEDVIAAASSMVCRPVKGGDLSSEAAGAATRLLAAAAIGPAACAAPPATGERPGRGDAAAAAAALRALWCGASAPSRGGPTAAPIDSLSLADPLAACALWGASGAWDDAAASRAAWVLLRSSMAASLRAPRYARAAAYDCDAAASGALAFLLGDAVPPGPQALVRTFLCFEAHAAAAAEAAAAGAAGNHGSRHGGGGGGLQSELVVGEVVALLQRPLSAAAIAALPPLAQGRTAEERLLAHGAWRALALAVLSSALASGAAAAPGAGADAASVTRLCRPDRVALAAQLAAAVIIAGAEFLRRENGGAGSTTTTSTGGGGGGGAAPMAAVESLLAATRALLLAEHRCTADGAAGPGAGGGTGDDDSTEGCLHWRDALTDDLRRALEAAATFEGPTRPAEPSGGCTGSASGGAGLVDAMVDACVADELRCCAAAALSACYGQIGVRSRGGGAGDGGGSVLLLARDADRPDVEITCGGGGGAAAGRRRAFAAHGVALSAASPVLRARLREAAAAGEARCGGARPLQVRLSDAVDPGAMALLLDFVYSGAAQLPCSGGGGGGGSLKVHAAARQQLRLLARALQMPRLATLAAGRAPPPGAPTPPLALGFADAALPRRYPVLQLGGNGGATTSADAAAAAATAAAVGRHAPAAAQLVAAHALAQLIPREAAAAVAADDPFADCVLAAPILDATTRAAPRALAVPAHRLLLAARCPYLAAATSARWGDARSGGGGGDGDANGGGRPLQVVVVPDADAHTAWALLRWLLGARAPRGRLLLGPPPLDDDATRAGNGAAAGSGGGGHKAKAAMAAAACCDDKHCRAARVAVRLRHCADVLLMPDLAAACDRELELILLHAAERTGVGDSGDGGRGGDEADGAGGGAAPAAACLAALLRDCAELGQAAAAEAALAALVGALLRGGPGADEALFAAAEWAALPPHLQQAAKAAIARRRRERLDDAAEAADAGAGGAGDGRAPGAGAAVGAAAAAQRRAVAVRLERLADALAHFLAAVERARQFQL